jgi:glycine hydroxymethyltransferase
MTTSPDDEPRTTLGAWPFLLAGARRGRLAEAFGTQGCRVMTGGTDNHLVVLDVMARGITGIIAEKALEECHITVNKNRIAGDQKPPTVTSGIRIGTNTIALRQMEAADMAHCADLVHKVLSSVNPLSDREYELPDSVRREVVAAVRDLCRRFPIPRYPLSDEDRAAVYDLQPRSSALG